MPDFKRDNLTAVAFDERRCGFLYEMVGCRTTVVLIVMLVLCGSGCTPKGDVKGRAYMDSDKSSEAFIEYKIPINK